jgi:integrase/recombinase XerD
MSNIIETLIQNKKRQLTDKNIKMLMDFDTFNKANRAKSELTRYGQIQILIRFIAFINKDYRKVTRKDVEQYLASRDVKSYTLDGEKTVIKKFYKYLNGGELYPDVVRWITLNGEYTYKKPEQMLTEEEIKLLISKCETLRDRAICEILHDTAVRVGELCNLKVGDVHNDGVNMSITCSGKTGERSIGLITSAPVINELLNAHTDKNNPKAPLFISLNQKTYGKPLTDTGVYQMLQVLRKRTGITKKISPHIFRHTTLTRYAKLGMNESQMRMYAGWTADSSMPEVYLHMTTDEVDDNRRALVAGQRIERKIEKSKLLPITCPRCHFVNDSNSLYCGSCWFPLTREIVERDITLLDMLRTKFLEFDGIDIDASLKRYQQIKTWTRDIDKVLACFNGGTVIDQEVIQHALHLGNEECIRLLGYLVSAELISLSDDKVTLLDKDRYKEFLLMHQRYTETNV